jgi:hypothetical protein
MPMSTRWPLSMRKLEKRHEKGPQERKESAVSSGEQDANDIGGTVARQLKRIGYWVTTAAIALETLAGGVTDLVHGGKELMSGPAVVQVVTYEGYPVYLLTILGVETAWRDHLAGPWFSPAQGMGVYRHLLSLYRCGLFKGNGSGLSPRHR